MMLFGIGSSSWAMKSVNEVSKLSGVSRRTLQYYDEIGLLPPSAVKKSGYRQYDDESLGRLWSILFYKELGFSLDEIRLLLENPKEMKKELMQRHKQILLEKQSQLQKLLLSVDRILNDEFDISMLRDFGKIISLGGEIYEKFRNAMEDGADSLAAKEAVTVFGEFISGLIPCDDAAFRKIAQAYLNGKEELDKKTPGLAEFVYEAILHVYQ